LKRIRRLRNKAKKRKEVTGEQIRAEEPTVVAELKSVTEQKAWRNNEGWGENKYMRGTQ